jgi:phospholipid transport system substrate-binding protein
MPSSPSRRTVLALVPGALILAGFPRSAAAFTVDEARALVDKVVGEINATIASGKSESAMIRDFENTFSRYADVPVIARSALGPAARGAAAGELSAYTKAFQGYISRKYGKRFREFIGGRIEVTGARPVKSYFEVVSTAILKGQAPFEVRWHVSDKSGKRLFFNLIIEGVNMLASERAEIGAMLDKAGGSIPGLTEALNKAG